MDSTSIEFRSERRRRGQFMSFLGILTQMAPNEKEETFLCERHLVVLVYIYKYIWKKRITTKNFEFLSLQKIFLERRNADIYQLKNGSKRPMQSFSSFLPLHPFLCGGKNNQKEKRTIEMHAFAEINLTYTHMELYCIVYRIKCI